MADKRPRITVIVPCFNDGRLVIEAVESIREEEPVEIVVVDDGSSDRATRAALDEIEQAAAARVVRRATNAGVGTARMAGLAISAGRYVLPLDADDLAIAGMLGEMADRLDADPDADAVVGDILEFGDHDLIRAVPGRLDPFRVAYTNEYPITAMFRRSVLEALGGWCCPAAPAQGYEDWNLWMSLAEREARIVHVGEGRPGYRRRLHGRRLNADAKSRHETLYRAMVEAHPALFERLGEHRRQSDLSRSRKVLYPVLYGTRASLPMERRAKLLADRFGFWTGARRWSEDAGRGGSQQSGD